jgi:hypothetical protein
MRIPWTTTNPEERRLAWAALAKFLFIVVLTALIFLLAQSMVRHRFFQGGWMSPEPEINQ